MKWKGKFGFRIIIAICCGLAVVLMPIPDHFPERKLFVLHPGINIQTGFAHKGLLSFFTGAVMRMDYYDIADGHRIEFDAAIKELTPKLFALGWKPARSFHGVSVWKNGTRQLILESGNRTAMTNGWQPSEPGFLASLEVYDWSTTLGERLKYLWSHGGP